MQAFCTYTIDNFKKVNKDKWVNLMMVRYGGYKNEYLSQDLDQSQIRAWKDCFDVLQYVLKDFNYPGFYIIFEYILCSENGARPDVILVSEKQVFVLEFKKKKKVSDADIIQADKYGLFMKACHVESRDKEIITCLVGTQISENEPERVKGNVHIVSPKALKCLLDRYIILSEGTLDIFKWRRSIYDIDRKSLDIMVDTFEKGQLPYLQVVENSNENADVAVAMASLIDITKKAKFNQEHWIIFIDGMSGAGKTFLGIKYTYEMRKKYPDAKARYITENQYLLSVIKNQLKSPYFMQNSWAFDISIKYHRLKPGNLIVFDDAQRMWSRHQMRIKMREKKHEVERMLDILNQMPWGVLVLLIGEGQSILTGEHGEIKELVYRIPQNGNVACSSQYQPYFLNAGIKPIIIKSFHLNGSQRKEAMNKFVNDLLKGAEREEAVNKSVNALLKNYMKVVEKQYQEVKKSGFKIMLTRNLEKAKDYCRKRYAGTENKKYGLIASSEKIFLENKSKKGKNDIVRWYGDKSYEYYCCNLNSEQDVSKVQGLELDMPIVEWYEDLEWDTLNWEPLHVYGYSSNERMLYNKTASAYTLKLNSYRVLLTRGRDGLIIYVPDRTELNEVYDVLRKVGLDDLDKGDY